MTESAHFVSTRCTEALIIRNYVLTVGHVSGSDRLHTKCQHSRQAAYKIYSNVILTEDVGNADIPVFS